jgi:two-component system, OmpR family, sensor histidine kinase VicK
MVAVQRSKYINTIILFLISIQYLASHRHNHEEKTEVLYGIENINKSTLDRFYSTKTNIDSCIDPLNPSTIMNAKPIVDAIIDVQRRGVKTRVITEITKDNLHYCKELMKIITELRHMDEIKGNFSISDRSVYEATTIGNFLIPHKVSSSMLSSKLEQDSSEAKKSTQSIFSTVRAFVEQQQYFFEMLWRKAIPAQERIKELEEGIEPEVIETIRDPIETQKISINIISSAKEEILILFSTSKAFYRQDKAGMFDLLKQAVIHNPNLKIRILTPLDADDIMIREEASEGFVQEKLRKEALQQNSTEKIFDIRHIESSMQTKISALITDRKYSLIVELKDDSKDNSNEAIGFATYSNSKATVQSYASIFESLWRQTELYQQIKAANEQLKVHDKMQKEFINVAAHELRNPIQPILSMTAIMGRMEKDTEKQELIDIVTRNAKKLKRLAEDILDVTRIESNSLQLSKKHFDLRDLVINAVQDHKIQLANENKIKLVYYEDGQSSNKDDSKIMMYGDKDRINQVISNLVSNSIKFTKGGGTISIKIEMDNRNRNGGDDTVTVSVKDTGTGIDLEIMPSLFRKFVTKSDSGTGLGLFISKCIVEAHGGKIWAENNVNGQKGATFYFNLPIIRS